MITDVWVNDIFLLSCSLGLLAMSTSLAYGMYICWNTDTSTTKEYIYKNYNYTITDKEVKDVQI